MGATSEVDRAFVKEALVSLQNSAEEAQDHGSLEIEASEATISGKWEGENRRGSRKKGNWWRKRDGISVDGHGEEDEEEVGDEVVDLKGFTRRKSLTDDDLHELKGCLDLGFGFSYEEIPELCNILPALELCYSISQQFVEEQQRLPSSPGSSSTTSLDAGSAVCSPVASWRISSPGDRPEKVKARLKFWAQAVACTIRLCN